MRPIERAEPAESDYDKALIEVSFLLDIFSSAVFELMGGATASVGRVAGRRAARKFPLYLPEATLETVLAALAARMRGGFEIAADCSREGAEVRYGRCVVREACRQRGREPGGEICGLFHHYLDGVVNELVARPVRSELVAVGEECRTRLEMR